MIPAETKLLKMLSANDVTFYIPPYQRNYEWSKEQCSIFLDDVIKTCELNLSNNHIEHFYGTITFFQTEAAFGQPAKLVLIDGQQRITTTMLLLVAIRDILESNDLSRYIDVKYLKNTDVSGDGEYKIKLKQVATDWEAFKDIILRKQLTDSDKNSSVYRNYKFFYYKLLEYKAGGGNLKELIEQGINKFSVVTIELTPTKNPWENPQEIFESMNSLGKPLSLADLVRNYLLLGHSAEKQEFLYREYWLKIEKELPSKTSSYIRDFMQAKEQKWFNKATESRYKTLYLTFKEIFRDYDVEKLLKEMSEQAEIYSYCISAKKTDDARIDTMLEDLSHLNVTTAYSFLLVLIKAWKEKNFEADDTVNILDAFRIYCLRRRLLGLVQGENMFFPEYAAWLPELRNSQDKKSKMFELLSKQESSLRLPNDIEISRHLETMNFYNFAYCKFYLALIEKSLTKSMPDLRNFDLQIEHIMPQRLNNAWKKELGDSYEEIHQQNVNLIGNLTLVRQNQEIGQKAFAEKKKIYDEKAGMQIARKNIINNDRWTADEIQRRSKWMIKYLLDNVLPIPDKMRRTNNFITKDIRRLSFVTLQLIGQEIEFLQDPSYKAKVVSDTEVEFENKKWRLSPLTREILKRQGQGNDSRSYQGTQFWAYDGMKLSDVM